MYCAVQYIASVCSMAQCSFLFLNVNCGDITINCGDIIHHDGDDSGV